MAITIDKNISIPVSHNHKKYPFDEMEIGDSFYVEANGSQLNSVQTKLKSAASHWMVRNRKSYLFVTRRQGDGIRIWRTE